LLLEAEVVAGVSWRLDCAGLVGDERGSTLLIGRGVVPGNAVQPYECVVVEGDPLSPDAAREVVLGRGLAKRLDVAYGDRINVATGTVSGDFNAATVDVIGELTYGIEEIEDQLGLFPIGFVQRLLKTDGIERLLIRLDDLDEAAGFSEALRGRLEAAGLPLTTRTWEELDSSYESIRTFYTAFSGLAAIGIFVFVFFSVLEVLTISFLERTREIGTIRAFGVPRARVFRSFLLEGIALGALGAPAGVLVGTALVLGFNALRFQWTPPGAAIPQPLLLSIDAGVVVIPLLLTLAATLVSALYPSWKASRQTIVDALRSV
jgi:putative ABC transport system permease protein